MKQVFVAMTIVALSMGVTYDDGRTDGRVRDGAPVAAYQDDGSVEANVEDSGHDVSDAGTDAGSTCVTLVYVAAEQRPDGFYPEHYGLHSDRPDGFVHGTVGEFHVYSFGVSDEFIGPEMWDETFRSFEIDGQDRVVCE